MIDLQSSRPIVALCHYSVSPEGCWRLAEGNAPGSQSKDPCALKGLWKIIHFNCPFALSVPLSFPKRSKAPPGYCQAAPSRVPKAFQGSCWVFPNLSKVFQATPSHFQKKDCLFFPRPISLIPHDDQTGQFSKQINGRLPQINS
jgi:hypothetical protein